MKIIFVQHCKWFRSGCWSQNYALQRFSIPWLFLSRDQLECSRISTAKTSRKNLRVAIKRVTNYDFPLVAATHVLQLIFLLTPITELLHQTPTAELKRKSTASGGIDSILGPD